MDRSDRAQRDIVGMWSYPTSDILVIGYSTTLDVRSDGTFTKKQDYRTHTEIYDGGYTVNDNGTVAFTVKERTYVDSVPGFVPVPIECSDRFVCRCGLDSTRHLVISCTSGDTENDPFNSSDVATSLQIEWESYMPRNAR